MQLLYVWDTSDIFPVGNHSQNLQTLLQIFSNTSNINAQIVIKYAYAKKRKPKTRKYMRIIISSYFIAWDTNFET